jgi:hypothetical protein
VAGVESKLDPLQKGKVGRGSEYWREGCGGGSGEQDVAENK